MIQLKAVAHPPDPLVPSVLAIKSPHWIGWAGKTLSRSAINAVIARDVAAFGPRGVLEVSFEVDLPVRQSGTRLTVEELKAGAAVLDIGRCTAEARDYALDILGLVQSDDVGEELAQRAGELIPKIFAHRSLKGLQMVLWVSQKEGHRVSYGALRDASFVKAVYPVRTPAFTITRPAKTR